MRVLKVGQFAKDADMPDGRDMNDKVQSNKKGRKKKPRRWPLEAYKKNLIAKATRQDRDLSEKLAAWKEKIKCADGEKCTLEFLPPEGDDPSGENSDFAETPAGRDISSANDYTEVAVCYKVRVKCELVPQDDSEGGSKDGTDDSEGGSKDGKDDRGSWSEQNGLIVGVTVSSAPGCGCGCSSCSGSRATSREPLDILDAVGWALMTIGPGAVEPFWRATYILEQIDEFETRGVA